MPDEPDGLMEALELPKPEPGDGRELEVELELAKPLDDAVELRLSARLRMEF